MCSSRITSWWKAALVHGKQAARYEPFLVLAPGEVQPRWVVPLVLTQQGLAPASGQEVAANE